MRPDTAHGRNTWISNLVCVVTEDGRKKVHPTEQAVGKLLAKIEHDAHWFPGNVYGERTGRPVQIPSKNKAAIARSAMAIKRDGREPTFSNVISRSEKASINPITHKVMSPRSFSKILKERCYDEDPSDKWQHLPRSAGKPLTEEEIAKRLAFGQRMEGVLTSDFYTKRVVWTDICCDLLPLTKKKSVLQTFARKGGSGWMSKGCRKKSYNKREDKGHLKIKQKKESRRVHWMPVLAQGKLHVEVLGSDFPGDKPEGMPQFVEKLRKAINLRFPDRKTQPNVVFVDRGEGFYKSNGKITGEFSTALRRHRLKAFHGNEAEFQPGRSGDLWLHETAVSWIRERLKRTQPKEPWRENEEEFSKRLKAAASYCTSHHDVDGLCGEFPARMHDLAHVTEGDRLSK